MLSLRSALALCGALALGGPACAQYVTLASESFQYPLGTLDQNNGGTGWVAQWFSGTSANVTTPGHDAIGEKATTIQSDSGCYRTLNPWGWPDQSQVFNNQFGTDGTTMYVRFSIRRVPGGDDHYGGLSLVEQFGPEKKFLGSPWMTGAWGIDDTGSGNPPTIVPGSNIDALTRLVYRIDFLPGQERLRMWIDPAEAYPLLNPDIDAMVGDFLFNEIRLQSGNGGQGGAQTGFEFDGIAIEIKSGTLRGDVDGISAAAGGTQTLTHHLDPAVYANTNFLIAGTFSGTSPGLPLAPGVILPLNPDPFFLFTLQLVNQAPFYANSFGITDGMGQATSTFSIPAGLALPAVGLTIHHASAVLDPATLFPVFATNPVPVRILP